MNTPSTVTGALDVVRGLQAATGNGAFRCHCALLRLAVRVALLKTMNDDGTILVMALSFELVVPRCGNGDCSSPEVIQGMKRYK